MKSQFGRIDMTPAEIKAGVLEQIDFHSKTAADRIPGPAVRYLERGIDWRKAFRLQVAEYGSVEIFAGPCTFTILNTKASLSIFRIKVLKKLPKTYCSYNPCLTNPAPLPRVKATSNRRPNHEV